MSVAHFKVDYNCKNLKNNPSLVPPKLLLSVIKDFNQFSNFLCFPQSL